MKRCLSWCFKSFLLHLKHTGTGGTNTVLPRFWGAPGMEDNLGVKAPNGSRWLVQLLAAGRMAPPGASVFSRVKFTHTATLFMHILAVGPYSLTNRLFFRVPCEEAHCGHGMLDHQFPNLLPSGWGIFVRVGLQDDSNIYAAGRVVRLN